MKKSHQQRMVVLGGPGTGKTTTLKYLAAQQANEGLENPDAPVPIYLSLAALARSGKSLQRYLIDIVEDMEVDPAYANLLWRDMQRGMVYVCLDSLDEVDPKMRSDMIDLINRKAQEAGNIWIVGSRFTEYKGGQFKAGQFSEWELQPMSAALQKELASRLFPELCICLELTHQEPPTAQKFVLLLEQHPRASAWGKNPLLLSLAAVVFLQQGYLPTSRILLYQHVIEAVLATREPDPIRRKILQRMLTELALWVHQQRGRTFTTEDLINFFMEEQRRSWGETNDLTHAVINSGIVEIVARQTYGFRHQTFQEYLAASELARRLAGLDGELREQAEAFIWGKRTYSRWTEVLRMMIGILVQNYGASGLRKALQWIERLAQQCTSEEGDPGFLSFSLALIAVSELGEIPEWHSPQTGKLENTLLEIWFDELIRSIQRGQDSKTIRLTSLTREIKHFQESSIDNIFKRIVSTLENKSRSIRKICLDILRLFGPRSINILLQLIQSKTLDLDHILLRALKEQNEHISLEALYCLLQDTDVSVRSRAIEAMGQLGERTPLEPLLDFLQDTNTSVRCAAISALGNLKDRAPLQPLLDALHDNDILVRSAAIRALGNLGKRALLEPLLVALRTNDSTIQHAAITALEHLGVDAPLNALVSALQNPNFLIRFGAIYALGNLKDRAPLEPLLAALQDTDSAIRRETVKALGNLGERAPLEPLLAALYDTSSLVQQPAAQVLRQRKDIDIEQMFANEVAGIIRSPYLYRIAIETLGELGEHIPLISLLDAFHDSNPSMRRAAVEALRVSSEHASLEVLIEALLHDTDSSVRRAAAFSLGIWREYTSFEASIVEALLAGLHDTDASVQQAAARMLGTLGDHVPLVSLLNALRDTNWHIRSAAITALKFLNGFIPLKTLFDVLHDEVPNVRCAALGALGEWGKHTSLPLDPLLNALHDTDSSVRAAAIITLGKLKKHAVPLELLLDALHNADASIRHAAVIAFRNLGEHAPFQPLLDALYDTDPNVQMAAGRALENIAECVPLDSLLEALHDTHSWTKEAAIMALQGLKDHAPLGDLIDVLYDVNLNVRRTAVYALGNLENNFPLDLLLETLQDEDSSVRHTTIRVIQKREPEALHPLSQEALALLQGNPPGPIFRSIASGFFAGVLGDIGIASPDMLEQLTEWLQWPYWQVRMKAAQALGKIRRNIPDEAIRQLLALRQDTDPHNRAVQRAADDALAEILSLETGIEDD